MRFDVQEFTIAEGDQGIAETVAAMGVLMRRGARMPVVHAAVQEIADSVIGRVEPTYRMASAIRAWVETKWEFRDDPAWAELLYGPDAQLAIIASTGRMFADCDDAAILVGALGLAAGLTVRVICVGFLTPDAPFTHTWAELRPPLGAGAWLEGDVTRPMQRSGVSDALIARAAAWDVA